jgi:hypothetical protein
VKEKSFAVGTNLAAPKREVDAPRSLLEKRRRWLALLTGRRNLTLDKPNVIGEGGPAFELQ